MLRTRAYVVPLAFAVLLAGVGRWSYLAVERASAAQVRAKLETILGSNVAALELWIESQKAIAEDLAADPRLVAPTLALAADWRGGEVAAARLAEAPEQPAIHAALADSVARHRFMAWRVWLPEATCLSSSEPAAVGRPPAMGAALLQRAARGETFVTRPIEATGEAAAIAPLGVMAVLTPIRDRRGEVVAILGLGIDAATSFSRLLSVSRPGRTGETYAISRGGRLLSRSRFEPQLREIGLLPQDPSVSSFRNVAARDPGGDLTRGHVPDLPPLARPLTRMAASASQGLSGVDVDGYRDYRGVRVVGAWAWLPDLELALATEIDADEAYEGLAELRLRFVAMSALLALAAAAIFAYSVVVTRMSSRVERARQLGRYRVVRRIGEGGMGTVYLARHALLRRPTAVKLLRREHSTPEAVARFEREVQVTASLSHPNTVEIYDYGKTPDGLFYYAMEYLDGVTLRACVDETGAMPVARALHVLLQVCGSIGEAHAAGMIHRDLKPSNVMLCERGRMLDFVKVVDFGLVRPVHQTADVALTDSTSLTGTPLYMAPETIESPDQVDARSDLYQIGAIGYFLLGGRHVFTGGNLYEVLEQHLHAAPEPLARVRGEPVPEALEACILRCLAKRPEERPASADELADALRVVSQRMPWRSADAEAWWRAWRAAHPGPAEEGDERGGTPSGAEVDIARPLGDDPPA